MFPELHQLQSLDFLDPRRWLLAYRLDLHNSNWCSDTRPDTAASRSATQAVMGGLFVHSFIILEFRLLATAGSDSVAAADAWPRGDSSSCVLL